MADPYLIKPSDIMGRVVSAQRGSKRRRIAGGWRGVWVRLRARLWRSLKWRGSRLLLAPYKSLAKTGIFRRLLPSSWQPRVFVFRAHHRTIFKLMIRHHVIGYANSWESHWHIRRPFHLVVDEASLPKMRRAR